MEKEQEKEYLKKHGVFEFTLVKPCESGKAYDLRLKRQGKIDFDKLFSMDFAFKAKSRHVAVLVFGGIDITVFPEWRLVVKTGDEKKAREIASSFIMQYVNTK